ncbi:MAG: radical SAM protein [Candidatus Lokiarchaeota archaeon]|nr:radical SAM protein [Candidatus Lokiarchaeota archaeon]
MKHVNLRYLESPVLYDIKKNEMYEIDEEALKVVSLFDGKNEIDEVIKKSGASEDDVRNFITYLFQNGLAFENKSQKYVRDFNVKKAKEPTLRNLLIHITTACNLRCVHCYIDKKQPIHLNKKIYSKILKYYDDMQGIKLMISGGEPLLHPSFKDMILELEQYQFRKILFTNSLLLDESIIRFLENKVEEIQISIDGTKSHEAFRKKDGSFEETINKIRILKQYDFTISVSTMIHKKNVSEMNELQDVLRELKVDNWYLDVPTITGDYNNNQDFHAKCEDAANILNNYGWGEQIYDWEDDFACGTHLCAIMANGDVTKCGLFSEEPVGNLKDKSLEDCWNLIIENYIWKQAELKCMKLNCPYISDCRGGCRYRAKTCTNDLFGIDEVKCRAFNFKFD